MPSLPSIATAEVDVSTLSGADQCLAIMRDQFMGDDQFQQIQQHRNLMKRRDTAKQKQHAEENLMMQYALFDAVCANSSSELFTRYVPISSLKKLNDHFCKVFGKVSESREWKLTGMLKKADMRLLETIVTFTGISAFADIFFHQSLDVLASLCAGRSEPQMFALPVAEAVVGIVNNLTISLGIEDVSKRRMFKRLESSGMLPQLFRALTAPVNDPFESEKRMRMIGVFSDCKLVKRELSPGTPSGDMLAAVLNGKAGFKDPQQIDASIFLRLKALKTMSGLYNYSCLAIQGRMCRNCNLTSFDAGVDQILKCSRCKKVFYCSAACQRADWKNHNKVCTERKAFMGTKKGPMSLFLQTNFFKIMDEYARVMDRTALSKAELILEIDFHSKRKGTDQRNQIGFTRVLMPTRTMYQGGWQALRTIRAG